MSNRNQDPDLIISIMSKLIMLALLVIVIFIATEKLL